MFAGMKMMYILPCYVFALEISLSNCFIIPYRPCSTSQSLSIPIALYGNVVIHAIFALVMKWMFQPNCFVIRDRPYTAKQTIVKPPLLCAEKITPFVMLCCCVMNLIIGLGLQPLGLLFPSLTDPTASQS